MAVIAVRVSQFVAVPERLHDSGGGRFLADIELVVGHEFPGLEQTLQHFFEPADDHHRAKHRQLALFIPIAAHYNFRPSIKYCWPWPDFALAGKMILSQQNARA